MSEPDPKTCDPVTCTDPAHTPLGQAEAARDAAYRERAHLVALLAAQYPSHIGHTDPAAPDWAVVTLELPTGQACWHIAPADMDLFTHVQPTPHYARGWDGHSTEEKYRRIRELVAELHPEAAPNVAERDGDVRAVAPTLQQHFGVQPEHSTGAFGVRTEADARELAAQYSRIHEPGCRPVPHYAVTRFSSDWQRLPDATDAALDARDAKAER